MKHIKVMGLLAMAAMAIVAFVGVSSASAATSFTASALGSSFEEATTKQHIFTITGSTTECKEIDFVGKTEGAASGGLGFTKVTQTVKPEYKNCTAFGFAATVTNNNCHYLLNANGDVTVTNAPTGTCSMIIKVENVFATCEATVGAQTITGSNTYSNAAGGDIKVVINASKIDGKVLKSSGLCPLTVGTHVDNGTYTGESVISAGATNLAVD